MNTAGFYQLMDDASALNQETLIQLQQILQDSPYFAAGIMLYLKNLEQVDDLRFETELKRLAVALPDRKQLFYYLKGQAYGLDVSSRDSHQLADENSSFSLVDAFLADRKEERESVIDNSFLFQPSVSSDYVHWTLTADDASVAADPAVPLQHQDLIDSFIQKEEERPAGNRAMGEKPSSETLLESPVLANETDSKSLDDSYFTETLAHIYVKQKRYEKALQIIKNLSLKYPEKNVYFADQIRFLEKLIINTKK